MKGTFTIAGQRVRTQSQFRFVAWITRRDAVTNAVTVAGIFGRSDSLGTLKTRISRKGYFPGRSFVIIDTATGEEV